jgi:hypothetical protein
MKKIILKSIFSAIILTSVFGSIDSKAFDYYGDWLNQKDSYQENTNKNQTNWDYNYDNKEKVEEPKSWWESTSPKQDAWLYQEETGYSEVQNSNAQSNSCSLALNNGYFWKNVSGGQPTAIDFNNGNLWYKYPSGSFNKKFEYTDYVSNSTHNV